MSTTPAPKPSVSWIELLISLGASLGSAYASGPIGALVNLAATTTNDLISKITAVKASAAGAPSGTLIVPIFVAILQSALSVALVEGKISATDSKALSDALTAMGKEDVIAQAIVDYSTIGPIAPE